MRLKDTPGGIPLTKDRRILIACMMGLTSFCFSAALLFMLASNEPIVNDYPKLKAMSLFSQRAAYFSAAAERENIVVPLFKWISLVIGVGVAVLVYRSSDPKQQKAVIGRGQGADSGDVLAALKAQQKNDQ